MKKIGMLKGMTLCSKSKKMSQEQVQQLQLQRVRDMVTWARENSPYYKSLYKNISDDFQLSDLPTVNKVDLMSNYDKWVTDPSVKLSALNEFMKNLDNIGRKYNKKYLVFTTSGSTGNPLVCLYDSNTNNILNGMNAGRTFARKQDMKRFIMSGGKSIGVYATGGFYLGNSSVRARLLAMPWKKKQMAVTSALLPIRQIVEQLNNFKPSMLGGYPSNLELLIEEQKSGRLHIKPSIIMTGGEYLSEDLRKKLSETFGCYVQTSYACTEGGTMACECSEHHFHINNDWLIIEPVDKDNNPVPDGVQSDKILLTNLYNYTQPFIRYEVTDRVVMHNESCKCGNLSPWLTLEGRTDDVVSFIEDEKEIKVAPLAIYAVLKEIHEIKRFQVLVHKNNFIELRLIPVENRSKADLFPTVCNILKEFFKTHGINNITYSLSDEYPQQHNKSGKFKHIINVIE